MKRFLIVAFCLVIHSSANSEGLRDSYLKKYDFITMEDTIFTFSSEFKLPDGYHYPDNNELTGFQNWLREFPLWHRWKWVGRFKGGKMFEASEIARPVHIPWDGERYNDRGFMLRILGEWYRFKKAEAGFSWLPKQGERVTYDRWLHGKPIYTARMDLAFKEDTAKQPSDFMFYSFVHFMMDDDNYRSFGANLDTISLDEVGVGDMLLSHDKTGKNGQVFIVMNEIENDSGDKLYMVGTAAEEACDFYIPKFDKEKDAPWLTATELHNLLGEYPNVGYFRFHDIPE